MKYRKAGTISVFVTKQPNLWSGTLAVRIFGEQQSSYYWECKNPLLKNPDLKFSKNNQTVLRVSNIEETEEKLFSFSKEELLLFNLRTFIYHQIKVCIERKYPFLENKEELVLS